MRTIGSSAPSSLHVGGNEVKHTGDGIMASFASVARAIESAIAVQRALDAHRATAEHPIQCGSASARANPWRARRLFGAAVQLAARACDHAAAGRHPRITAVRELCVGKGFTFEPEAPSNKGFEELIPCSKSSERKRLHTSAAARRRGERRGARPSLDTPSATRSWTLRPTSTACDLRPA